MRKAAKAADDIGVLDGMVQAVAQLLGPEQRNAMLLIGEVFAVHQRQIEELALLDRQFAIPRRAPASPPRAPWHRSPRRGRRRETAGAAPGPGGCRGRGYDRAALPCLIEWQCLQSGLYVLGIEPSTNHLLGRSFAEGRGELIELQHGEMRRYRSRLSVLDGGEAVAAARAEILALQAPPEDFAPTTEVWPVLRQPS